MTHVCTPEFNCPPEQAPEQNICKELARTEISCLSENVRSAQEWHSLDENLSRKNDPCVNKCTRNYTRFCKPTNRPNHLNICRTPGFQHREVRFDPERKKFCGQAEFGAIKCQYECNPDQFEDYLRFCDDYGKDNDCRKTFPQPGYRTQHPDLAAYDTIECALDKDYMTKIMKNCPCVEDIDDTVLESLEAKLKCLRQEEKIHNAGLTDAEKIALYSIAGGGALAAGAAATGAVSSTTFLGAGAALVGATLGTGGVLLPIAAATGIVYGVGALIRKIRSEKARRNKLGLDKKEFRRLRKLEKIGKKYGKEDFRHTAQSELSNTFQDAIVDKESFKDFKKSYKKAGKQFRADYKDEHGNKAWRKQKKYVKVKNREEQKIIDAKARREIAKTKNAQRDRKKFLRNDE